MTRDRRRHDSSERETEESDRSEEREFATEEREDREAGDRAAVEPGLTVGSAGDLDADRRADEAVAERVAPESAVESAHGGVQVAVTDRFEATRPDEAVARTVAPSAERGVEASTTVTERSPAVEREETAVSAPVRFAEEVRGSANTVVVASQGSERYALPVTERFHPMADRGTGEEYPVDDSGSPPDDLSPAADPVFDWTGGSPYTSRRPAVVVHRDEGSVPTLPFLRVLLRDGYREMVGSEPTADRVEFVAGEPRFPSVSRSVLTLDLSDDGWDREVRNGRPVIEREGVDVVPELRGIAETLYAGELGYLVVNVPDAWEDPLRHDDFFDRLVAAIAGEDGEGDGPRGPGASDGPDAPGTTSEDPPVDRLGSPPVVLAEPRTTDPDAFAGTVARYFGLTPGRDPDRRFSEAGTATRVERLETLQERVLRQDDWRRVAATETRASGEESDEHYLWKAALVDGLVQRLYRQVGAEYDTLRDFHRQEVLAPTGRVSIHTEWTPDGADRAVADVLVDGAPDWETVRSFLGGLDSLPGREVALEVETGIGEGAHNFRSLRRTLDGYGRAVDDVSYVGVVVPPRLLFRGRRRAGMLADLVESWADTVPGVGAGLYVPRLAPGVEGGGTCWELTDARTAIGRLYGQAGGGSDPE